MDYLSIASVFKDEDRYLDEWITYHTLLGVDYFYLLNNSTDPTTSNKILSKYPHVRVNNWQHETPQVAGFNALLNTYGYKTKWLAFLDTDEFIYPTKLSFIPDILRRYEHENIAALAVHWCIFGSSGKEQTDLNSLVIENFFQRAELNNKVNNTYKLIVRPSLTKSIGGSHWAKYKAYKYIVNEKKQLMPEGDTFHKSWKVRSSTMKDIRINHYCTKSAQEYRTKIARGFVDKKVHDIPKPYWKSYFEEMDRNEIRDDTMKRFIPQVKEKLSGSFTL